MKAKHERLTYIFHDPNTPEEWESVLAQWYADAIWKRAREQAACQEKNDRDGTSG